MVGLSLRRVDLGAGLTIVLVTLMAILFVLNVPLNIMQNLAVAILQSVIGVDSVLLGFFAVAFSMVFSRARSKSRIRRWLLYMVSSVGLYFISMWFSFLDLANSAPGLTSGYFVRDIFTMFLATALMMYQLVIEVAQLPN